MWKIGQLIINVYADKPSFTNLLTDTKAGADQQIWNGVSSRYLSQALDVQENANKPMHGPTGRYQIDFE